MDRYDRLGDEPPRSDIAANDAAHEHLHAHTGERHGPDVPLRRDPAVRDLTLEGRIYGDPRWTRRESAIPRRAGRNAPLRHRRATAGVALLPGGRHTDDP
ncbi:hypothetical protein [Paractinoplanes rishiriensis]|uniref:hypothetical protein n=1 Tax=Paractinoplanes rishiriensis TaxID=1050105 RepID=UPI00194464CC|nr:hypothetical protein [Actinoplanes rishiriensis]